MAWDPAPDLTAAGSRVALKLLCLSVPWFLYAMGTSGSALRLCSAVVSHGVCSWKELWVRSHSIWGVALDVSLSLGLLFHNCERGAASSVALTCPAGSLRNVHVCILGFLWLNITWASCNIVKN